jgi:hypothetical protein
MKRLQRYVSTELTHFVGRTCKDDDSRYEVLKAILCSGKLEPRRRAPLSSPGGYSFGMRGNTKLSSNKVYDAEVVCFCDIPVEDFEVHMRKYSRFGLAFGKSFLVRKEANPGIHGKRFGSRRVTRAGSFDAFFEAFRKAYDELFQWVAINGSNRKHVPKKLVRVLEEMMKQKHFLNDLFSYFKFFDSKRAEASELNFYMEREWRIRGTLEFHLDDVRRVILPENYARRFRNEFQEFWGQITFSN